MGSRIGALLYVGVMILVIICADILFFRHHFVARLMANVGIVLVFGAFYLTFVRKA